MSHIDPVNQSPYPNIHPDRVEEEPEELTAEREDRIPEELDEDIGNNIDTSA